SANANRTSGTILVGYDDWSNLQYYFLEAADFANGTAQGDQDEMDLDLFEELNAFGPTPGMLEFRLDNYEVNESGGEAVITVTRSGGTLGAVTVDFATVDGSAVAGSDYLPTSGTLTFADGEYR